MKYFVIAAVLAATTTPALADLNPADSCGALRYKSLIGQPASAADPLVEANIARVLGPRAIVSLDYWPLRMNIVLDEQDMISQFYCG